MHNRPKTQPTPTNLAENVERYFKTQIERFNRRICVFHLGCHNPESAFLLHTNKAIRAN